MRRQQYRARDKTVRKMGRDGLSEENLRSGEAVRVSRRENDTLLLPRTADDSMNFQDRRSRNAETENAGGRHRYGYSSDFKRPGHEEACSVQHDLHQAEWKETDSSFYMEDLGQAGSDTENAQVVRPDGEDISETKPGARETSVRQSRAASYGRASGRRKNDILEPRTARCQRQKKNAQRKNMQQGIPHEKGHVSDTMQENPAEMKIDHAPGAGSDSEAARGNMPASIYGGQDQSSRMENVREQQMKAAGNFRADGGAGQDHSHDRKKKQVYAHARKMEGQKKAEEGRAALAGREEKRSAGNRGTAEQALPVIRKDAQKKDRQECIFKEQKKKAGRLQFGEEKGMVCGAGMRLIGRTAVKAANAAASVFAGDGQEDGQDDMGAETLQYAGRAGDKALRYTLRPSSRRMQKRNRQKEADILETGRKKGLNKFYQKQKIKKAYAEAKRGEKAFGETAKTAGTFWGKAKETVAEFFRNKKGLLMAAIFILLLFLFFAAGVSSCSAMAQGTSSVFIGTTYPSEDEDIYDAEEAYRELEEALDGQINRMEATHPGYDEYRYQVDEIAHDPYQLISLLTVLYEEFTYAQIEAADILPVFFSEQYHLTVEEITEIRTRAETQTVTDPLTGEEAEQEVEVEYEWHVLCICLSNKGFDTVAREHMTQEQAALYDAYNMTFGNRSYLFDTAEIPAGGTGGYEIPEEALSDEQFARMVQEAEKYLGRAYVWGGASPETGFDCSGFVSWVINNSGNGWDVGRQTAEGLRQNCTSVPASAAKPGDLIFFQGTYNTSGASHVGIYVGDGMMIHAGDPVKYSNINTPYWKGHFLSYGRIG